MAAQYPGATKTFAPKVDGGVQIIMANDVNEITDEVTAVEADLRAGLPIARGGTGATTAAGARTNLDVPSTGSVAGAISGAKFDASAIISGIFDVLRIPGLAAAKIISGVFDAARIPALNLLSGTLTKLQQHGMTAYADQNNNFGPTQNFQGYVVTPYVNTTDDVSVATITHMMAKFGDSYHRSATAAKVRGFLGLNQVNADNGPVYVWANNGDPEYSFLAHRPSLSVNYAASAGAVPISGITGGTPAVTDPTQYFTSFFTTATYIQAATHLGVIGVNFFMSDARLKTDIRPTEHEPVCAAFRRISFVDFKWKPGLGHTDTGRVPLGVTAQDLQAINPRWVDRLVDQKTEEERLMPNSIQLLTYAMKAIQELDARVAELEARGV